MKTTVTKSDLIAKLAKRLDISEEQVVNFIDKLNESILKSLESDKKIIINGLGVFKLVWGSYHKNAKLQAGAPREFYKLKFEAEDGLKELVNKEFAHLQAIELSEELSSNMPLDALSKQAVEIKDVLSEIQDVKGAVEYSNAATTEFYKPQKDNFSIMATEVEQKTEDTPIPETTESQTTETTETAQTYYQSPTSVTSDYGISNSSYSVDNKDYSGLSYGSGSGNYDTYKPKEEFTESNQSVNTSIKSDYEDNNKRGFGGYSDSNENNDFDKNYYSPDNVVIRKKKTWIWLLLGCLVIVAVACGYLFMKPQVCKFVNSFFSKKETPTELPAVDEVDSLIANDTVIYEDVAISEIDTMFFENRKYTEFIDTVTISSGVTMAQLADQYWGSRLFWVYIFEANKDNIANANRISVGTKLRIPKLDNRLTDKNDTRLMDKVKELEIALGKK